jgi:hypothetical protein
LAGAIDANGNVLLKCSIALFDVDSRGVVALQQEMMRARGRCDGGAELHAPIESNRSAFDAELERFAAHWE